MPDAGPLPRDVARRGCALLAATVLAGCHASRPARVASVPAAVAPAPGASTAEAPLARLSSTALHVVPPHAGWALGRVSWVASDRQGLVHLLQRGDSADPVVVLDREGRVVRSWGRGLFTVPHSIRVDRQGNVWTTDAYTSDVRKFAPDGTLLLTIAVGPAPAECLERQRRTCGTTDAAVAPDGHVYVTDGYWNARVLEFTADGRRVREWGTRGDGPGAFALPHSIVIGDDGTVYVADRDNHRVQRFDRAGRFLGAWPTPGSPFSLELVGDALWIGAARAQPSGAPLPTLVRLDLRTGRMGEPALVAGGHGLGALPGGDVLLMDVGRTVHALPLGAVPR